MIIHLIQRHERFARKRPEILCRRRMVWEERYGIPGRDESGADWKTTDRRRQSDPDPVHVQHQDGTCRRNSDIIRVAVPTMEAAAALTEIKRQIHIPLVADIHFDYRLAIAAIECGADKIRINPGNIGSRERIQAVVDKAKEYGFVSASTAVLWKSHW